MSESVNDQAVRLLAEFGALRIEIEPVNDFGEVTGLREEYDQLRRDMEMQVQALTNRAGLLRQRIRKLPAEMGGRR